MPKGDVYEKTGPATWTLKGNIAGPPGQPVWQPNTLLLRGTGSQQTLNVTSAALIPGFSGTLIGTNRDVLALVNMTLTLAANQPFRIWLNVDGIGLPGRMLYQAPGVGGTFTASGMHIIPAATMGNVARGIALAYATGAAATLYDEGPTAANDGNRPLFICYELPGTGQGTTSIPVVSALPTTPFDGQEVYYLADAANGVIWHLRYRAAASGSYKWEFVGGSDLYSFVNSGTQAIAQTVTAITGVGFTIPLAGDYLCEFRDHSAATVATSLVWTSFRLNNVDMFSNYTQPAGANYVSAGSNGRRARINGVAAASVATLVGQVNTGTVTYGDNTFKAEMSARPIRVG